MEEKIDGKIYVITCTITNKVYVGQTKHPVEVRFKRHCSGQDKGMSISQAIKKHGKENFKIEVVEFVDNQDDLNKKEIEWIAKLDSNNGSKGYNATSGGRAYVSKKQRKPKKKGYRHTDEAKCKIKQSAKKLWSEQKYKEVKSKALKKLWQTEEYRKKIIESRQKARQNSEYKEKHKKTVLEFTQSIEFKEKVSKNSKKMWSDPVFKQKRLETIRKVSSSPEFKEKMRKINKERMQKIGQKPFDVFVAIKLNKNNLEIGELIKTYKNKEDCIKELSVDRGLVNRCLAGTLKQAKGYIFKYNEELNEK